MSRQDDLVKRLRAKRERVHDLSGVGYVPDQDCLDAADEIDALRAKLAEAEGALAKVSGALNDAFAAGAEEREGGSWRRQGMLSERYEAVRAESKDALASIREALE